MKRKIRTILWGTVALLLTMVLIYGYTHRFAYIKGVSMEPTVEHKQWVFVEKMSSLGKDWAPQRYDVIVLEEDETLCKRVIALPGETVEIREGDIYVNDRLLKDPFGHGRISFFLVDENDEYLRYWNGPNEGEKVIRLADQAKKTIPKDSVWVIGDNREVSWYGVVPVKNITGLVVLY